MYTYTCTYLGINLPLSSQGLARAEQAQLTGNGSVPLLYPVAQKVVFSAIRAALGLDRMKFALTGAAPMTMQCLSYFESLGLHINEVYGMSESTGATTWSTNATNIWGSCGFCMPGLEVKVDHQKDRGDKPGEGEICFRGRHIMLGYLKEPAKTAEAIDECGWLHSGDIGRQDALHYGAYQGAHCIGGR
jgi:long-chain-fatty-acid--CoA ligase ACSBG